MTEAFKQVKKYTHLFFKKKKKQTNSRLLKNNPENLISIIKTITSIALLNMLFLRQKGKLAPLTVIFAHTYP